MAATKDGTVSRGDTSCGVAKPGASIVGLTNTSDVFKNSRQGRAFLCNTTFQPSFPTSLAKNTWVA
jgi:hypothetical protein